MRQNNFSRYQVQQTVASSPPAALEDFNHNEFDCAPSADEVARKAYFSYVNQGSPQGCAVQHWLEAEAELLAERNLTRLHGFHNRT
jgi:hypothetical protein